MDHNRQIVVVVTSPAAGLDLIAPSNPLKKIKIPKKPKAETPKMITIGSGSVSIQLYSRDLQSFQKDCLFLEQDGLFKVSYVPQDNGIKVSYDTENLMRSIEVFWEILTKNFAAITCETEKKIIFLVEEGDSLKKIVNCSYDLRTILGGTPCRYDFDELIREEKKKNLNHIWHITSLDGVSIQEKFLLKRKELLACFGNHKKFWAYQFSISKRVYSAEMAEHQPPIPSVG